MRQIFIGIFLILAVCLYRLAPVFFDFATLPNFAPVMAIALCGGFFLPVILAWVIPFSALFLTDMVLNIHYSAAPLGQFMIATYACYALAVVAGLWLKNLSFSSKPLRPIALLSTSIGCSILFYVVTNTACWVGSPAYTSNFSGWVQALTTGQPGFPPTWSFFRHSLASDLIYTSLFMACMALGESKISFHVSPVRRNSTPAA